MELLAPAGDLEKLETVYRYGADAAYIGLAGFSLRQRARNLDATTSAEYASELRRIKGRKRLYGALNIYFHDEDLDRLEKQMPFIAELPLDAIIVSDVGAVPVIRSFLPDMELHLSTQANCLNARAAHLYRELGFSRIIPAREMTLTDLERMKLALPELALEVFVHGAMCLAYSGRCLLSAWESGRSANKGDCSHSCRWNYRQAIEEERHPGEYMPIEQEDGYSTILSSRDLCMIDHIAEIHAAGIDAVKIEGRMKSAYYAAVVTRAYRKEIDRVLEGREREPVQAFIDELYQVSHREFSTGFYFDEPQQVVPTRESYVQSYRYMGRIGKESEPGRFSVDVKNSFSRGDEIEYLGPDIARIVDREFELFGPEGEPVERLSHQSGGTMVTAAPIQEGYLVRMIKKRASG